MLLRPEGLAAPEIWIPRINPGGRTTPGPATRGEERRGSLHVSYAIAAYRRDGVSCVRTPRTAATRDM